MGSNVRCPICGKEVMSGAKFCVQCGTELMDEQQSENAFYVAKDIDQNNSFEFNPADKGGRMDSVQADYEVSGLENEKREETEFSQNSLRMLPPDQIKEPTFANSSITDKESTKKRGKLIAVIGTITVVLFAAVVVLFFVFRRTPDDARTDAMSVYVRYNKGELSYEQTVDELNQLFQEESKEENREEVNEVLRQTGVLKESKDAFTKGEESVANQQFEQAIEAYGQVAKDDENYSKAQKRIEETNKAYLDSVYSLADTYLNEHKYTKAIDLYNKAKNVVAVNELDVKISKANELKSQYEKQQIDSRVSKAKELFEKGDYSNALVAYKNLYNDTKDEQYKVKIEEVENKWVDTAIIEAEGYLKSYKCDAALACLISVKSAVSDGSLLKQEEERIEDYRPVDLSTEETLADETEEADTGYYEDEVTDNVGNVYPAGSIFFDSNGNRIESWYNGRTASKTYFVDGKYDQIKGVFALLNSKKNCTLDSVLRIYADEILIYTSPSLHTGVLPIEVSADISGAKIIKIEYSWSGDSDETARTVFGNAFFYKKYKPLN